MDFYASKSLGKWTPNHKPEDGACENAAFNGCCGKCDKSNLNKSITVNS